MGRFFNKTTSYDEQPRSVMLREMLIVLPILLLLVFTIISFGYVFIVYEDLGMVVTSVGSAIQNNPSNTAYTQGLANTAGAPFISFSGANTICAQSYKQTDTITDPYCTGSSWVTSPPKGVTAGTPYVVAIEAHVTPKLLFPYIYSWLLGTTFTQKTIITVAGSPNYPVCPAGQSLTSVNGSSLSCATPASAPAAASTEPSSAIPSGTFCGNGYQTNCGGKGESSYDPHIIEKSCAVNGKFYDPVVNCPVGYSQYKYVMVGSSNRTDTCYWTCMKN